MAERVVITGMGIVCPMGHDVEVLWRGLLAGESGVAKNTIFDASTFPTTFDAEVKDYNLANHIGTAELHKDCNRGSGFVLGATAQACRAAGIDIETDEPTDGIDRERLGIYLGAGEGSVDNDVFFAAVVEAWDNETNEMNWGKWAEVAFGGMDAMRELEQEPSMPAAHIALLTGARGPTRSCLTACAASTQATGEASMIIRRGDADVMIAGGTESATTILGIGGFCALKALTKQNDEPQKASKPFDLNRDGFVMAEGAGVAILESLDHAKKRGAPILAEIVGYGRTSDAYHITAPESSGAGAARAMEHAMKEAGLAPQDISYINAHGTSTKLNDLVETLAIKTVFKDHAKNVPVSSTKSMTGHLLGAAGGIEFAACVCAIQNNIVPPTINYETPDPDCDLDYVPNTAREVQVTTAMSNSLGFGGHNASIIVKKFQE